jgi:hypothetical protein
MLVIHQVYQNILQARNTMLNFEMKKLGGNSLSNPNMHRFCIANIVLDSHIPCLIYKLFAFMYRQRAAAKGQESEAGRRKQLPAPDGNSGLQVLRICIEYFSRSGIIEKNLLFSLAH